MTSVSSSSSSSTSLTSYVTSGTDTSAASATVDWSGLIEAMVQAKLSRADTIDAKITANQTKISSYQDAQSLLQDLTAKTKILANLSGSSNSSINVFNERSGYLTANGSVTPSSVVSVDVASGTQTGTYDLAVDQLAKANKISSGAVVSNSAALGYTGAFSIGLANGGSSEIDVTSGMTLADIAGAINNVSSSTGVTASIVKVDESNYNLILTATSTGQAIVTSSVSGDDIMRSLGVTDSSGKFSNELQAAQPAKFDLDGVQITRSTNDISDVMDGVTFHLYSTTPADTSVSIQIAENLSDIQTAINNFVTSYNSFRDFVIAQNKEGSDGTADSSAVLFGDPTLRGVADSLQSELTTSMSCYSLADMGLSFDENNKLVVDSTALTSALNNNLAAVSGLLQFGFTSSSTNIRLLAHGAGAPTSFTLDIAVGGDGTITSASVGGDSSLFTISGTRIVGKAGTAYEGFSFSFSGQSSESIGINLSYGLADKIYSSSTDAGDATSGSVQSLIQNLDDDDTDLTARSSQIKSQADTYRTTLTQQYARIQQAILQANSTIAYLKLLTKSSSD